MRTAMKATAFKRPLVTLADVPERPNENRKFS